ncbi:MAG: hypothetical protein OXR68_08035 [Alphaproteobacteria bacterium]|nr:hypothetical protein [Alphaproteobacteria bacterium]MDD9920554.1 hypothetical protein [Alphaproteobacteria bacterium]
MKPIELASFADAEAKILKAIKEQVGLSHNRFAVVSASIIVEKDGKAFYPEQHTFQLAKGGECIYHTVVNVLNAQDSIINTYDHDKPIFLTLLAKAALQAKKYGAVSQIILIVGGFPFFLDPKTAKAYLGSKK